MHVDIRLSVLYFCVLLFVVFLPLNSYSLCFLSSTFVTACICTLFVLTEKSPDRFRPVRSGSSTKINLKNFFSSASIL